MHCPNSDDLSDLERRVLEATILNYSLIVPPMPSDDKLLASIALKFQHWQSDRHSAVAEIMSAQEQAKIFEFSQRRYTQATGH